MSIESVSAKPLDIGEVLSDTFAVIGRSIVILANLAVMLIGIPAAVTISGVALTPLSPAFAILTLIGSLGLLIGVFLAYGSIFAVAMANLHGQPPHADGLIKIALAKFWPMIGLAILAGLGVFAGCLLLIVPGIVLALAWCVALPALVLENRGIIDSFKRSAALTRNKRWSIFLLLFVVGLVIFIGELVLVAMFGGFQAFVSHETSITNTVVSQLLEVITIPFNAVLITALFNQLRGDAGYGAEAVGKVFA